MNILRAKEIAESPKTVKVTLDGVPVYIQRVNEENHTARVFPLDDTENEQVVPLASLKEH